MSRNRIFRYVTLALLGLYVIIPMYASVQFSLEGGYHAQLSFDAYTKGLAQPGLGSSIITSLEVSFGAMVLTLGAARADDHLRPPAPAALRPVLEALSLLPLGVPAVVIVVGVLGVYNSAPSWIIGSPLILALLYVIWPCRTPTGRSTPGCARWICVPSSRRAGRWVRGGRRCSAGAASRTCAPGSSPRRSSPLRSRSASSPSPA